MKIVLNKRMNERGALFTFFFENNMFEKHYKRRTEVKKKIPGCQPKTAGTTIEGINRWHDHFFKI